MSPLIGGGGCIPSFILSCSEHPGTACMVKSLGAACMVRREGMLSSACALVEDMTIVFSIMYGDHMICCPVHVVMF